MSWPGISVSASHGSKVVLLDRWYCIACKNGIFRVFFYLVSGIPVLSSEFADWPLTARRWIITMSSRLYILAHPWFDLCHLSRMENFIFMEIRQCAHSFCTSDNSHFESTLIIVYQYKCQWHVKWYELSVSTDRLASCLFSSCEASFLFLPTRQDDEVLTWYNVWCALSSSVTPWYCSKMSDRSVLLAPCFRGDITEYDIP